ncbi:hypothetical protein E2C01_071996 [Portunus trituberculatus]|uniref:Uncharacterized protein n=1 Tax=Portunus trituberculatus TaxID=210409 RepID=A0A5B7I6L1_PORTR|nr:hypothetical protein [Portunus trituberculatus]
MRPYLIFHPHTHTTTPCLLQPLTPTQQHLALSSLFNPHTNIITPCSLQPLTATQLHLVSSSLFNLSHPYNHTLPRPPSPTHTDAHTCTHPPSLSHHYTNASSSQRTHSMT